MEKVSLAFNTTLYALPEPSSWAYRGSKIKLSLINLIPSSSLTRTSPLSVLIPVSYTHLTLPTT
ncbi:hypothetical protein ACNQ0Y_25225, partial [Enterobacter cloacae complex sp.6730552]|uniref:hypothetical protein n=1 Tax=Enterobacter cloacae complex sp.6730552 TaxID=3397170 RepID=UPI003AAF04C0